MHVREMVQLRKGERTKERWREQKPKEEDDDERSETGARGIPVGSRASAIKS